MNVVKHRVMRLTHMRQGRPILMPWPFNRNCVRCDEIIYTLWCRRFMSRCVFVFVLNFARCSSLLSVDKILRIKKDNNFFSTLIERLSH